MWRKARQVRVGIRHQPIRKCTGCESALGVWMAGPAIVAPRTDSAVCRVKGARGVCKGAPLIRHTEDRGPKTMVVDKGRLSRCERIRWHGTRSRAVRVPYCRLGLQVALVQLVRCAWSTESERTPPKAAGCLEHVVGGSQQNPCALAWGVAADPCCSCCSQIIWWQARPTKPVTTLNIFPISPIRLLHAAPVCSNRYRSRKFR